MYIPNDFLILILSSPSGTGKTTLCHRLRAELTELTFSISHTTRAPRASEKHERDYYFVDVSQFQKMIHEEAFAEWAEVYGNYYGTSLSEIDRAQRSKAKGILFDIDYQGARQIRAKLPCAISIFLLPPSMQELEQRLRGRASDTEDSIQRRLTKAKFEIENYSFFDYLIVNKDLDQAYDQLRSIVVAERARRMRTAHLAETLLRKEQT